MTYVILDHISHEQHRQEHTDTGIDEVKCAVCDAVEPRCYGMMDEFDGGFQEDCSKTTGYTDKKGKYYHHVPFRHACDEASERR